MEFKGKTVLITGGASGIGLLAGKCFAEKGAKVALADISQDALDRAKNRFTEEVLLLKADVRNFKEVEAAVNKTIQDYGTIDVLINCAGGASTRIFNNSAEFCDLPIEQIDWGIDVNLKGVMYFCHEAIRKMREQKSGVIINLGSITGIEGDAHGADYATAKSAVMNGLNKSLAKLGARYGIRVNCVAPGPVLTRPGMANMKTAIGRAADPQEIVDMFLYLASKKGEFMTGITILMDGGRHLMFND